MILDRFIEASVVEHVRSGFSAGECCNLEGNDRREAGCRGWRVCELGERQQRSQVSAHRSTSAEGTPAPARHDVARGGVEADDCDAGGFERANGPVARTDCGGLELEAGGRRSQADVSMSGPRRPWVRDPSAAFGRVRPTVQCLTLVCREGSRRRLQEASSRSGRSRRRSNWAAERKPGHCGSRSISFRGNSSFAGCMQHTTCRNRDGASHEDLRILRSVGDARTPARRMPMPRPPCACTASRDERTRRRMRTALQCLQGRELSWTVTCPFSVS